MEKWEAAWERKSRLFILIKSIYCKIKPLKLEYGKMVEESNGWMTI